ncbi:hypothetical protein BDZ91DRAFT_849010 [Kalaharituber pfeilii]|nr:hypothetical protein BDZ91DRAFT_849010 [Kalaharituber pfeilii]
MAPAAGGNIQRFADLVKNDPLSWSILNGLQSVETGIVVDFGRPRGAILRIMSSIYSSLEHGESASAAGEASAHLRELIEIFKKPTDLQECETWWRKGRDNMRARETSAVSQRLKSVEESLASMVVKLGVTFIEEKDAAKRKEEERKRSGNLF